MTTCCDTCILVDVLSCSCPALGTIISQGARQKCVCVCVCVCVCLCVTNETVVTNHRCLALSPGAVENLNKKAHLKRAVING
jgi:hypothetical protein